MHPFYFGIIGKMELVVRKDLEFANLCKDLVDDENILKMKDYPQHGRVSTYEHVFRVAFLAYFICKKLYIKVDYRALIMCCILHDFYLYDWHNHTKGMPLFKKHGFVHPMIARDNAKKYFDVDDKVARAIESHMWPLNINEIPNSKEAWLLCIADKLEASMEIIFER